ncbi:hypothetical protein HanPI659440_Chr12g0444461 [Helianthus annuus]|nr:hypothetical protein HanPI659440_Chr12g0444461 [Helianthus annuus]
MKIKILVTKWKCKGISLATLAKLKSSIVSFVCMNTIVTSLVLDIISFKFNS